jgi:quercetin dioxygenase-like cupin family protein
MQRLVSRDQSQDLELIAVFFDNGARTKPHIHSTDQVLITIEGTCVVASESGHRHLHEGEYAFTPAGNWHWHGAAPGESACHISIRKPGPTDWDVPKHNW